MKVKVQFVKEEIVEIPDVYKAMVEDCRKALLGESTMSEEEWDKWVEQLETEVVDKVPFDHTKMYLVGVYNLDNEPLAEFQKGFDTMNNNKIFETDKIFTQHLDPALKPKDKTTKCRVAKVGAGVVILPNNGNPITAKEIVKALGLKEVEPEVEKEKRNNCTIWNEYTGNEKQFIRLTNAQERLLDWLEDNGYLEDGTIWEEISNVEFEEI